MANQTLSNSKSSVKTTSVHDWDQKIRLTKKQIKNELSNHNVEILEKYDKTMVNQSIGKPTRQLHLHRILSMSRRLGKDWDAATKEDVENIIFEIMDTYSNDGKDTNYTYDHKKVLKIFFRWLKLGNRDYKYCLKKFKTGDPSETEDIIMRKPDNRLTGSDLISDEEKDWLLDACTTPRDRALIDMALDGGFRPGELLTLTIDNIKHDKYGYVAYVNGKTGPRTVRLIQSTPSIARWLSVHPFKDDPNSPLWIILEKTKYGQPLSYSATRSFLNRVSEKVQSKHAGFKKRVFLNLFRHTEATNSAKFMNEGITKKRHGWSSTSKMPARYTHLVNADVDDVILRHHGIEIEKEKPKVPIKCQVCGMINPADAKDCSNCGRPTSLEALLELEEDTKQREEKRDEQIAELKEIVISLKQQVEEERFGNKLKNTILYKNQDKIPGLSMTVNDPKALLDLEKSEHEFAKTKE